MNWLMVKNSFVFKIDVRVMLCVCVWRLFVFIRPSSNVRKVQYIDIYFICGIWRPVYVLGGVHWCTFNAIVRLPQEM